MAATVSAWAKPGAWALDSEENEAQLLQQFNQDSVNGNHFSNGNGNGNGGDSVSAAADFPSLATAAATATKSKKKSKGQTLSLQEFTTYGAKQPQASKGPTPDELMALPTGPRQRSAEELERSKLGGGFRSYGNNYDRPSRGSSDERPRRERDSSRDFAPSRADEIDDWGAAKKPIGNGFERRERGERGGGGFFSDSQSRADEVDNWASNKSFVPSEGRRNERRGVGFESNGGAESENWVKRKEEEGKKFGSSGGAFDSLRERRGGGFDSLNGGGVDADNWGRKREESSGRPRLNLQPRTLPVREPNEGLVKPKGSSPFGDARPREEVLKEKGQDWKEIEEKLESAKIKEGSEEKPAFGRRGFGSGNWRGSFHEDKNERTWRKPEPQLVDACPPSAEKTEDGQVEEAEDKDLQM